MKKFALIIVIIMLHLQLFAQSRLPDDKRFDYTEIINVDSVKKDLLFGYVKVWLGKTYKSANNVIQVEDKETGKIIVKAITSTYIENWAKKHDGGKVDYILEIDVKDNKVKLHFYNYSHNCYNCKGNGSGGSLLNEKPACGTFSLLKKYFEKIKDQADDERILIINSFKEEMKKIKTNNDW
jgi:hypothetical protein